MTSEVGDVLSQADALMRRHRSFVARPPEAAHEPPPTPAMEEADIPLLTEIVAAEEWPQPSLDALLDDLKGAMDAALSAWLVEMLPVAVAQASQHILAELDAQARATLLPRLAEIVEAQRARLDR